MLTKDLAISQYDFARGQVLPDRLTRRLHHRYVDYARRMLQIYSTGTGRMRKQLHRDVHAVLADEPDCPVRRIDAFCKLLDDASRFDRDRRGRAAQLRREVFRLAARRHPLVAQADRLFGTGEQQVKAEIAQQLGRSWPEIEADLFSDVMEYHRLAEFPGYPDPQALLARYNVAQVQAALYGAVSMTVWAREDFKTILRYAKLARLMHTISGSGQQGYRLRLDGPASVLRQTRRYGAALARFLPALIACRQWRMQARVRVGQAGHLLGLELSAESGLQSHLPPPEEFDSKLEQAFAEKWGPEPRDGWTLLREAEILQCGQKVFLPDFVFQHHDGRRVLLEIVGFWTPEYLEAKLHTLQTFRDHPILLAVQQQAGQAFAALPARIIPYKSALRLQDVLQALEGQGA